MSQAIREAERRVERAADAARDAQVRWVRAVSRWQADLEAGLHPMLSKAEADAIWLESRELFEKYREASEACVLARCRSESVAR